MNMPEYVNKKLNLLNDKGGEVQGVQADEFYHNIYIYIYIWLCIF